MQAVEVIQVFPKLHGVISYKEQKKIILHYDNREFIIDVSKLPTTFKESNLNIKIHQVYDDHIIITAGDGERISLNIMHDQTVAQ